RDPGGQYIRVVNEVEGGNRVETIELKKTIGNDHQQRDAEKQQQHQQQRTDLEIRRQEGRDFHGRAPLVLSDDRREGEGEEKKLRPLSPIRVPGRYISGHQISGHQIYFKTPIYS